ncbi:hypothetical protein Dimus_022798, partial [Dionaea muscipula]
MAEFGGLNNLCGGDNNSLSLNNSPSRTELNLQDTFNEGDQPNCISISTLER